MLLRRCRKLQARPRANQNRVRRWVAGVATHLFHIRDVVGPGTGTKSVWLAYIETGVEHEGGLDGVQTELEERGYRRTEHRYFWNPMWLDHYELNAGE